jgi:hypothetical protein
MGLNAFDEDPETPTAADLDSAYGSKFLSASDLGDSKVKTRILKVRSKDLPQQEGTTRRKIVLFFQHAGQGSCAQRHQ